MVQPVRGVGQVDHFAVVAVRQAFLCQPALECGVAVASEDAYRQADAGQCAGYRLGHDAVPVEHAGQRTFFRPGFTVDGQLGRGEGAWAAASGQGVELVNVTPGRFVAMAVAALVWRSHPEPAAAKRPI